MMENQTQRLCPSCEVPVVRQGVFQLRTGNITGT